MTCEERKDLIPSYAWGTLDPAEREELWRHLATGCKACAAELRDAESLASDLAFSLEPVAPPSHVRARLMERIKAQAGTETPVATNVVPNPYPINAYRPAGRDWMRSILTASIAAAIAYFAASLSFQDRQGALQNRLAQLETQLTDLRSIESSTQQNLNVQTDLLGKQVRTMQVAMQDLTNAPHSPAVQVVALKGTPDAPDAKADLIYDRARGVWYLYTSGLKPPGENRAYELWFIVGETKTRVGVFDVTPAGEGSLIAATPPDLGKITLAAITDEPAGGSLQPTGKIHVAGAIP